MIEFGDLNGISPESNPLHGSTGGEMLAPLIRQIPVKRIAPDPDQPRRRVETTGPEWDSLVASVQAFGILEPIAVRPHPDRKGDYVIIFGERRWRVADALDLGHIPARIIKNESFIARKMEIQLAENALREGLCPLDEMEACVDLLRETGMAKGELARRLGVTNSVVSDILALERMVPAVRERVRAAEVRIPRRQLLRVARAAGEEQQHGILDGILVPAARTLVGGPQTLSSVLAIEGLDRPCTLRIGKRCPRGSRDQGLEVSVKGLAEDEVMADVLREFVEKIPRIEGDGRKCA